MDIIRSQMSVFFPKVFLLLSRANQVPPGINLKLREKIGKDAEAALSHLHVFV